MKSKKFHCVLLMTKYIQNIGGRATSLPSYTHTHTQTHTHTHTHTHTKAKQGPKVSVLNIRDSTFYRWSEIIQTRTFTIFTVFATIFGQFTIVFRFLST